MTWGFSSTGGVWVCGLAFADTFTYCLYLHPKYTKITNAAFSPS